MSPPQSVLLLCKSSANPQQILDILNGSFPENSLTEQDDKGRNALYNACYNNLFTVVKKILTYSNKYDMRCVSAVGYSPLIRAITDNRREIVKEFFTMDLHQVNNTSDNASNNISDNVSENIDSTENIDNSQMKSVSYDIKMMSHLTIHERDAVLFLCHTGMDDIIEYIIENNPEFITYQLDKYKNSALTQAILHCSKDIVWMILNNYSNLYLSDINHLNLVFAHVCYKNYGDIIEFLITNYGDLLDHTEQTIQWGTSVIANGTPLVLCLLENSEKLLPIKLLQQHGFKCNIKYNNYKCIQVGLHKNRITVEYILDNFKNDLCDNFSKFIISCEFNKADIKLISQLINLEVKILKSNIKNLDSECIYKIIDMIDADKVVELLVARCDIKLACDILNSYNNIEQLRDGIKALASFDKTKESLANPNNCMICMNCTTCYYCTSPCEHVISICDSCFTKYSKITKCVVCRTKITNTKKCYVI